MPGAPAGLSCPCSALWTSQGLSVSGAFTQSPAHCRRSLCVSNALPSLYNLAFWSIWEPQPHLAPVSLPGGPFLLSGRQCGVCWYLLEAHETWAHQTGNKLILASTLGPQAGSHGSPLMTGGASRGELSPARALGPPHHCFLPHLGPKADSPLGTML